MNTRKQPSNAPTTKKSKSNKKHGKRRGDPSTAVLPYRGSQLIIQDRQRTCLRFWKNNLVTVTSTAQSTGFRFIPSAAYDVDPLIASTAMPGFTEFANLYSSYRVLGSRCTVEAANTSAIIGELVLCPTNTDMGASPTSTYVISAKSQPYAKSKMVPGIGAPPTVLVASMTTAKLYGSEMVLYDDNFASLVNNVPNNNWYWFVGLYTQAQSAGNISISTTVDVDLEFYDRKVLQN